MEGVFIRPFRGYGLAGILRSMLKVMLDFAVDVATATTVEKSHPMFVRQRNEKLKSSFSSTIPRVTAVAPQRTEVRRARRR